MRDILDVLWSNISLSLNLFFKCLLQHSLFFINVFCSQTHEYLAWQEYRYVVAGFAFTIFLYGEYSVILYIDRNNIN